MYKIHKPIASW